MSAPLDEADPWLTLAEIAAELRVNPATVRLWISRGQLNATRPGRRKLLVRRSELDRMLAEPAPGRPGQLRVELPAELHAALLAEARSQGVCLNTLAVALLARRDQLALALLRSTALRAVLTHIVPRRERP